MSRPDSPDEATTSERPQHAERFVADASDGWWDSPDGLETRRRIEEEVWSRHQEAFERSGPVSRALLRLRIRNEIQAECARVLWARSSDPQKPDS